MTVSLAPKRALSVLIGAALAGTALLSTAPASALGSPFTDYDNLSLSPSVPGSGTYTLPQTVTISGSGLAADTYRLSICQYTPIDTTIFGSVQKVPACSSALHTIVIPEADDGVGTFSVNVALSEEYDNAHYTPILVGQPAKVDPVNNLSEFVLTPAHGGPVAGSPVADSQEFTVS